MELGSIRELLVQSLDDLRLSRNERQSLVSALEGTEPGERKVIRSFAFELAESKVGTEQPATLLQWLEDVLDALHRSEMPVSQPKISQEAHFSPGDDCLRRIIQAFDRVRESADVCVFTITDDRISGPILDAHHRGVKIRVLTDNDKALDPGSDIDRFHEAGIPIRVDRTEFHMHHKFAIFDTSILITGSYNWTRGAADQNQENFIVTPDPHLITCFQGEFERLWAHLS
jgi:phosphatidylserine/phosphatidylglycerophosphate/cardiolipin synthase-like enzyme